jgi:hypothetical protein
MNEVTLKEHFEKILSEKDKAINIALAAAKEAVLVAETNSEKWRSNANEWRGAMTDREKTFATKAELQAYKENTEKALAVEKERADIGQGRSGGLNAGWVYLLGFFSLISMLLGIYGALK